MNQRVILFLCVFSLSCGEDISDEQVDSVKPDVVISDTLPDIVADSAKVSVQQEAEMINTCEVVLHPVCVEERRWLDACATVVVRPNECSDVAAFTKQAFRAWLNDQSGHGLLVYLGTDSSGAYWTMEVTQADASGYYFAYFYRRTEAGKTLWRSLLDSQSDCGEEPTNKQMAFPFGKRVDIYVEEFGLQNLSMDSTAAEIPNAGTMSNDEGVGYEEQKLTVTKHDGTVHRWFFIEGTSMCWSTYTWEMR